MPSLPELYISLTRSGDGQYWVELRFSQPDAQSETAPQRGPAAFNFPELLKAARNPQVYGKLLSQAVFGDAPLLSYYKEALAITQNSNSQLRLRLLVDRSAPELHSLRWETLLDPADASFLSKDQNLLFSRFLYSDNWNQVELRSRGDLRAVVLVANPSELSRPGGFRLMTGPESTQSLAPVDVSGELARATQALAGVKQIDILTRQPDLPGTAGVPTFKNLSERLLLGCDILYLVCHGALLPDDPTVEGSPQRPYLVLENDDGSMDRVEGERLVEFLDDLTSANRPRLAVLASCQSAGVSGVPNPTQASSTDEGALAALGPRLAEAGIPAVIAMQDNVQMETVRQFMPQFFKALLDHGRIDQAMAAARRAVDGQPDWWAPVLFIRLKGGQLWYTPSFAAATPAEGADLWQSLKTNIQMNRCVPVLGFGLLEFLAGTPREIARRWAEAFQFPLEAKNVDSLPQVAQYLSVRQGFLFPRDQLVLHIQNQLRSRYQSLLPQGADFMNANELISTIGKARREMDEKNAYRVLANLPFSIYLTANPDSLLEDALNEAGRTPVVRFSYWNKNLITPEDIQQEAAPLNPTARNPIVYHLFGTLDQPESMVLTEDDYFEYMMWVNNLSTQLRTPDLIVRAWREKALLFLGFSLNDWSFRVLYRSILNSERQAARALVKSVSVQLQPGEINLNPDKARQFLEQYFPGDKFNIYWGSGEDFLRQLWEHWSQKEVVA
jgi:hypothetical protein